MKKMSKNLIVLAVGLGVLLNPNALSILSPDFTASAKETRVEVINVVPVQTTKGVHLTWSSTGFADYYEVIRMNNYKVEQSYTTRDKDVFDPDVEPGVYEYLVIPYRNGLPALSGYARFEVLDLKKQVAIIDLRVNKKDNNVALRWSSGGNPDEIVITRKRGNVQEIEHTVKGSLTSFKDPSPLKPGQYNYLITPFKKGKPGISEEAVVTVEGDSIEEDIQILNLTAQPTKDGILLEWDKQGEPDRVILTRYYDGVKEEEKMIGGVAYLDTGARNFGEYKYILTPMEKGLAGEPSTIKIKVTSPLGIPIISVNMLNDKQAMVKIQSDYDLNYVVVEDSNFNRLKREKVTQNEVIIPFESEGRYYIYAESVDDRKGTISSGLSRFLCKLNQPIYEQVSSP